MLIKYLRQNSCDLSTEQYSCATDKKCVVSEIIYQVFWWLVDSHVYCCSLVPLGGWGRG